MKSALFTSTIFDDPGAVAAELTANLAELSPKPVLGILFCDSQVDGPGLAAALKGKVSFPLVGGTSLSFPFARTDGAEMSAALLVINNPDLKVGLAVSEPLDAGRAEEQMRAVYEEAVAELGETPAVLMPFAPLMPGVNTNAFISQLFKLAGNVPVFGGVSTSDLISTSAAVFAQDEAHSDRLAVLALGGGIKPVLAARNLVTRMSDYSPTVTDSQGGHVRRVDDMSLCDYLRHLGINPEDRINGVDALMQYGPIPVQVRVPGRDDNEVPEVRCISFTNVAEGSAMFSGDIPVGARLSVSLLSPEDVAASARDCLKSLRAGMAENPGCEYSAVIVVSCVARYFVLAGGDNSERAMITDNAPAGVPLTGIYGFSEICPTFSKTGTVNNRSHSASIVMLAF